MTAISLVLGFLAESLILLKESSERPVHKWIGVPFCKTAELTSQCLKRLRKRLILLLKVVKILKAAQEVA